MIHRCITMRPAMWRASAETSVRGSNGFCCSSARLVPTADWCLILRSSRILAQISISRQTGSVPHSVSLLSDTYKHTFRTLVSLCVLHAANQPGIILYFLLFLLAI